MGLHGAVTGRGGAIFGADWAGVLPRNCRPHEVRKSIKGNVV